MFSRACSLTGLALVLVTAAQAWAQDDEKIRAIAAAAQQAALLNQWEAAEFQLKSGFPLCRKEAEGRPCRLLLEFNLGYLYEQRSLVDEQRQEALLEASASISSSLAADAGRSAALEQAS